MGRYDDITPERLRADLVAFARLILRLDQEDGVLTSPADIQKLLGELRQKLFAYEIRGSSLGRDPLEDPDIRTAGEPEGESDSGDPGMRQSLKVVREAIQRSEEMLREWDGIDPDALDDEE